MSSKQVLLKCFHLIRALINLSRLLKVLLNSSQLFCKRKFLLSPRSLLHKKTLGAESFCAQKLGTQMHLHIKAFTKYVALQSLHKALLPVLLRSTKLAQSTPQYYFVLQSLRKLLPTTVYYKACTKHVPVLVCTTKLAQSTSLYYCVLQSPHVSTHMATEHDNNHAAITQRSATRGSTNAWNYDFPKSPYSLCHHCPRSPLPFVTTLRHSHHFT